MEKINKFMKSKRGKTVNVAIIAMYILYTLPAFLLTTTDVIGFLFVCVLLLAMVYTVWSEEIKRENLVSKLSLGDKVKYQGYISEIIEIKEKTLIIETGNNQFEVTKKMCSVWKELK